MGQQNVSLNMIERLASALEMPLILAATEGTVNFEITGPTELAGEIEVRSSKNAAVALLCASMLNRGRTVLRGIARIEEVDRICDVLQSIGVTVTPTNGGQDLELTRPEKLTPETIDQRAARRTRSILMFLGPLMCIKQFIYRNSCPNHIDVANQVVLVHIAIFDYLDNFVFVAYATHN